MRLRLGRRILGLAIILGLHLPFQVGHSITACGAECGFDARFSSTLAISQMT